MSSQLSKLASQTAVYGISTIVARLLNYLLTPYYTYMMSRAEYGVITDMYALIPFLLVLLTMGMESGYFRFAAKADTNDEKRRVFATTWGSVIAASLAFMVIVLLFRNPLAEVTGYSDHLSYIWIVGAIVTLDAISAVPYARLREQGRAGRYVVVRVISVVVNLLLCLFFYSLLPHLSEQSEWMATIWQPSFGAGYAFVANLISSALTLVLLLPTCDGIVPRITGRIYRKIALYSLPLLVSGIAGTANEYIDRQMIKYLLPEGEAMASLGVYGAVVKIGVISLLFTQMYRLAAEPFFLSNFKKDDFRQTSAEALKYYMIVSIAIFLLITLFTDLFALIVGPAFREGMFILPVVLVANILSGVVLNLSFWYKQSGVTRFAFYITGTGLIFTVAFNYLLVPRMGYYGAALSRLICESAMVCISLAFNHKYFPTPYDWRRMGEYVAIGVAMYGLSLLSARTGAVAHYSINLLLLGGFACYAVWREKIDMRKLLKAVIRR